MAVRYSFGGDEHIFVEVGQEMSLEAFFKSLSITNAVRESRIKGVTEICPANASFQIKFDPDLIQHFICLAIHRRRLIPRPGKNSSQSFSRSRNPSGEIIPLRAVSNIHRGRK